MRLAQKRGEYLADAGVIVGALVSALSSDAFERGDGDKKRFIELLVNIQTAGHNPPFSTISFISLDKAHPGTLRNGFISSAHVTQNGVAPTIDASTVDTLSEADLLNKTSLTIKEIRQHSYACLFYESLRCSYLHEYRAGHCALLPDTDSTIPHAPNIVMYDSEGNIFFSL